MNSDWQDFLNSQAARIDVDERVQFPPVETEGDCQLVDLSHLGLISVTGGDSELFLQGQTTNDVRNIGPEHFQISALCTPKGRMQASFIAFHQQDGYLLQMPRATQQTLLKRLPMFVLMSDVVIADASDRWARFGVLGRSAEALLGELFGRLPERPWKAVVEGRVTLLRHAGERPRFELIGPPQAMIELWQRLARSATPVNSERWALERIRAGIPTIHGATSEAFLPQMANMQLIDGVSFTKGCYTGQEVVARTKYLGKVKRRMYLATVDSDTPPQPGDELFAERSDSDRASGRVVDAAPSPNGGYELLAVVEIERQEQEQIHLGSTTGATLSFNPLPYPFEQEQNPNP
ncbi:MAG: folate-binding protein YgfZ [Gammaproteobacteria bacterium]|nr:folate-binding protein YgfZ [Gammaproteobacteria bacterium]